MNDLYYALTKTIIKIMKFIALGLGFLLLIPVGCLLGAIILSIASMVIVVTIVLGCPMYAGLFLYNKITGKKVLGRDLDLDEQF